MYLVKKQSRHRYQLLAVQEIISQKFDDIFIYLLNHLFSIEMAGRPSTQSDSLESSKGFIIMLIREQACTVNEIREHLATEWEVEPSEVPSTASINRKLKTWGARICDLPPEEHKEALRKRHEDYT